MTLQEQFPLSPRKFWKKMLSGTSRRGYRRGGPLSIIITLVILGVYGFQFFTLVNTPLPTIQPITAPNVEGTTNPFPTATQQNTIVSNFQTQENNLIFEAIAAFIGLLVLWWIIKAFYVAAYIRNYFYDANDSFVTIKKGVFAPQEIHVQWNKVQDVYVDQDFLDRLLGLYDVHLASATQTSGMEAHIDGVERSAADGLKQFLLSHVSSANAPQNPATPSIVVSAPASPIGPNENVSSDTYPISGAWLGQKIIGALIGSAILGVFVPLIIGIFPYPSSQPGPTVSLQATYGIPTGELMGIGLVVFIVLFAFIALYSILWRANYSFAFLPDYITMRTGIITKREMHLTYRTIQDVVVSQSFWGRIFGIANVDIQNAVSMGGGVNIPGQPLSQANALSDIVKRIALTKNPSSTGL